MMDDIFSEDVECVESIGDVATFDSNSDIVIGFKGETRSNYAASTPNRANRLLEFTEIINSIHSDRKVEVKQTVSDKTKRKDYKKTSSSDYSENDDDSDWEESENLKKKRLIMDQKAFKQNLQHVDNLFE